MQVIDASIVVKWYKTEENTDKALQIRNRHVRGEIKIAVPDLIILELANTIRYKENSTSEDVEDVLNNFAGLELDILMPTIDLLKKASKFAFDYDITIYDSIYAALAAELGYEFITADEKLYEKIKDLGYVKLLKEI